MSRITSNQASRPPQTRASLPETESAPGVGLFGEELPGSQVLEAPEAPKTPETVEGETIETPDGRSTRWDDHRVARRTELAHAARKTVHRLGPEISMDEIATQLGTSKSILYRYFSDKVGLQNAVGETVVRAIHDALAAVSKDAESPRAALQDMVVAYLEMIEHSPNVYYFVTRNAQIANSLARPAQGDLAQSAPLSSFLHSVVELVAQPFAREVAGLSPAQISAWSTGAVGFVTGTGEWWLANRGEAGVPQRLDIAQQITAWLWAGPGG